MFLGLITGLVLQIAFVALLVLGARRLLRPGTTITAVDVRQLFQFALMYGLVIVVAIGASELVSRLLGAGAQTWDPTDTELAQALGFVVVGGVLLSLLVAWTRKRLVRHPEEENTVIYAAYVTVAALTALAVASFTFGPFIGSTASGHFDGSGLATVVVWGLIWFVHWTVALRTLPEERNTPHLLLGSLLAVILATTGFTLTIQASVDLLNSAPVIIGGPRAVLVGAGILTVGALIWIRYWATKAQRLPRSPLWMLFTLPLGVGGGLALALGSAGAFLWEVLVWFLGVPGPVTAEEYFSSIATELALAIAGLVIWWYFRTVLGEQVNVDPMARRVYLHLMAGIGLGTAAVGAAIIVGAFVESLTPAWRLHSSPVNWMLGGLVLLLIGAAVWLVFWSRMQKLVALEPEVEEHTQARRIYLLSWIWGGAVAAAIALIVIAVQLFQMLVSGTSFQDALYSARYALGTLLVAATLSVYHAMHYKTPPAQDLTPRSVLIIGSGGATSKQLREQLGSKVPIREGAVLVKVPFDLSGATETLAAYPGRDVVVLTEPVDPKDDALID